MALFQKGASGIPKGRSKGTGKKQRQTFTFKEGRHITHIIAFIFYPFNIKD
jgi:hypothetical protein